MKNPSFGIGPGQPREVVVIPKASWHTIALLVVVSLFAANSAGAQTVPGSSQTQSPAATEPTEEMRKAYDAAFQETLRKPSDPATLVAFAEIAIKTGDLEGAISALDRLLLIDADQPEVKLELGVLYFRLGSFEAARGYLDEARSSKRASPALRERAASYLKEIKRP
jgi:tetratricopeptide (TPR) repeat protein